MDVFLLIPFGLILVFSVINCAIRGRKRSLVRLIFVVLAALIALLLTPVVSGAVAKKIPLWTWDESSMLTVLAAASPTLGAAVHGAPKAVFSLAVYPLLFLLLCLLMTIPVSIVNRKTERSHKGQGALIGLAVGVIGFTLAFAPLCALGTLVLDAVPEWLSEELDVQPLNELLGLSLDEEKLLGANPLLRAEAVPGRPMLNLLTTARENGKSVSLAKELRNLLPLYTAYTKLDGDALDILALLPTAVDCAERSELAGAVVDELQDAAREIWSEGKAFLGYDPQDPDGGLGELLANAIGGSQSNLSVGEIAAELEALLDMESRLEEATAEMFPQG